ncbi:hypothetical protein ERJ75_000917200 [Trypanosoma vivax]|nr:hypothetical protein ERJ75_000917200 [Trypanosoma vivax]
MEELGIKNNAAKMEVLDPTCLSGFGDARRLTCARVLGAFVECDAAHEAEVTEAVDKRARETERLFRAILECPLAARTRWRLLSASALPRLTFLLRNHAAKHTRGAAEWFDARVTAVLSAIVGRPVSQRARDVAALPIAMGGCGLRRQVTIAEFAHECVGHKNLQRSKTEEADRDLSNALFATVYGDERRFDRHAHRARARPPRPVCTETRTAHRRARPYWAECTAKSPSAKGSRHRHVNTAPRCTATRAVPQKKKKTTLPCPRLVPLHCTQAEPQPGHQPPAPPAHTRLATQADTDLTATHPAPHPPPATHHATAPLTYEQPQAGHKPSTRQERYQQKPQVEHWPYQNGITSARSQTRRNVRHSPPGRRHRGQTTKTKSRGVDFVTGDMMDEVLRGNVTCLRCGLPHTAHAPLLPPPRAREKQRATATQRNNAHHPVRTEKESGPDPEPRPSVITHNPATAP